MARLRLSIAVGEATATIEDLRARAFTEAEGTDEDDPRFQIEAQPSEVT